MPRPKFGCHGCLVGLGSLALACATYEASPVEERPDATSGSASVALPQAGHSASAFGGSAGHADAGAGGANKPGGAAAGGTPGAGGVLEIAGSAGSAGDDAGGAAATPSGELQTWTFDGGPEGWVVREQSSELAANLTAAPGALQLLDVPFSAPKQYVDLAYAFESAADLRGRTLRATLQRTSGGFVGAQLYAYGGAWVSPGFESLSSGDVLSLSLQLDTVTTPGFTPDSVARIGIKLATGSNASNTFGPTSIELTEIALE